MNKTTEFSARNEPKHSAEGTSRSITSRLSTGPIVAAGRLMSYLSKQPRNTRSTRHYTTLSSDNEKVSFRRTLSKQISFTHHYFSSSSNSDPTMHNSKTTPSGLDQMSKTVRTSVTPNTPTPDTVGLDFNFDSTYSQLRELAQTNCQYFSAQKNDVCKRFEHLLIQLLHSIDSSMPLIRYLTDNFHHFDYSPEV